MDFTEVIRRRRSIRAYSDRLPDRAIVDQLVDIARRAPTAGFSQGIDFVVVDEPSLVAKFWALVADPEDADEPQGVDADPMVVIVLSDPGRYIARYSDPDKIEFGLDDEEAWPVKFWDVDAGMAAMQLQLAAVNEGIDTWFFGVANGETELRDLLSIPETRQMIGVIALGYRTDDEMPVGSATTRARRALSEQLHRNGW